MQEEAPSKAEALQKIVELINKDLKTVYNKSRPKEYMLFKEPTRKYLYINEGTFGKVFQCDFSSESEKKHTFAIKVMKDAKINSFELEMAFRLSHYKNSRIVRCYHYEEVKTGEDTFKWGILKFCKNGSLKDVLKKEDILSPYIALSYFSDILRGCLILQRAQKIFHRDLKCANILIHDHRAYLGDLGSISTPGQTNCEQAVGTPESEAPEITQNQEYDSRSDIWSLGIILYKMLYGYHSISTEKAKERLNKSCSLFDENEQQSKIKEELKKVIQSMLKIEPDERITWDELFKNEVFKKSANKQVNSSIESYLPQDSFLKSSFLESLLQNGFFQNSNSEKMTSHPLSKFLQVVQFQFATVDSLQRIQDMLMNEVNNYLNSYSSLDKSLNEQGIFYFLKYSIALFKKQCIILASVKESLRAKTSPILFSGIYPNPIDADPSSLAPATQNCLDNVN